MYSQVDLFNLAYGQTLHLTPAFMECKGTLWNYEDEADKNKGIKFLNAELQAKHENPATRAALFQEINAYFFMKKTDTPHPNAARRISFL